VHGDPEQLEEIAHDTETLPAITSEDHAAERMSTRLSHRFGNFRSARYLPYW
jgi:hypothetical protein